MQTPKFCVGEEVIARGKYKSEYDSDKIELIECKILSGETFIREDIPTGWFYKTENLPENMWWSEDQLKKLPPKKNAFEEMMEELKTPNPVSFRNSGIIMNEEQKKKAWWLSDILLEYSKGDKEFVCTAQSPRAIFPDMDSNPKNWQLRPIAKKPVDLSVLIDGIDCEFGDRQLVSKLIGIDTNGYVDKRKNLYAKCQPRMDHWHSWHDGGDCPLPEGIIAQVILRNDTAQLTTDTGLCHQWYHDATTAEFDIIAFKVLPELKDGFCMPWECES